MKKPLTQEEQRDEDKKKLLFKFAKLLVDGSYSSNKFVSAPAGALLGGAKGVNNFVKSIKKMVNVPGEKETEAKMNEDREKLNNENIRKRIKMAMDEYIKICDDAATVKLLKDLSSHTGNEVELLKFTKRISSLSCEVTAKEHAYILKRYADMMLIEYDKKDHSDETFSEIRNRNMSRRKSTLVRAISVKVPHNLPSSKTQAPILIRSNTGTRGKKQTHQRRASGSSINSFDRNIPTLVRMSPLDAVRELSFSK